MLVCYLDDSGKDPQNPITTIAGYAATAAQWQVFEWEVEPIFAQASVQVLHTRDLHHTDHEFKGWEARKKRAFVAQLSAALSRHVLLGVSMSAHKETYKARAKESDRKRTSSPYTFCSNVIIEWLLTDIRVGRIANTEGVELVLEDGHQNNGEAKWNFEAVCKQHGLEGILQSMRFIPKSHCRAIQMADLFAFYSRRHGVNIERAQPADRARVQRTPGVMLDIMTARTPHRAFVAMDFGPNAPGSRFFAGDPKEAA